MDHTIKSGKKSNSNSTNVKIIYLFLLILGIALGYFCAKLQIPLWQLSNQIKFIVISMRYTMPKKQQRSQGNNNGIT